MAIHLFDCSVVCCSNRTPPQGVLKEVLNRQVWCWSLLSIGLQYTCLSTVNLLRLNIDWLFAQEDHPALSSQDRWGGTPLSDAISTGQTACVDVLLDAGARQSEIAHPLEVVYTCDASLRFGRDAAQVSCRSSLSRLFLVVFDKKDESPRSHRWDFKSFLGSREHRSGPVRGLTRRPGRAGDLHRARQGSS